MPGSDRPEIGDAGAPGGPGDGPGGAGKGRSGPLRGVYYGWILVAVLGVTETTSWGILYYAFTVVVAVVFMLTSLSLAILAKEKTFSSTVIDLKKKETSQPVPAAPADKPAADSHSSGDPATAH